jgi:hypothetical protein
MNNSQPTQPHSNEPEDGISVHCQFCGKCLDTTLPEENICHILGECTHYADVEKANKD